MTGWKSVYRMDCRFLSASLALVKLSDWSEEDLSEAGQWIKDYFNKSSKKTSGIIWTYQRKNIVYFLTNLGKTVDNSAFTMYVIDRMFKN